jgi:hypothetical protein
VPDRNIRSYRLGVKQTAGDINGELSLNTYDDFFAALMMQAAWVTGPPDTLKVGTTLESFTVEAGHTDIAQFQVFTGLMVNRCALSFRPNALSSVKFSMVGKDMTVSASPLAASPTAAPTDSVFTSWDGTIKEGGSTVAYLTALDMLIDNGLTLGAVLGSPVPPQVFLGRCHVNGSLSAYFQDAALLSKFIGETQSSIEIDLLESGTKTLNFIIPAIKYNRGQAPVSTEGGLVITLPFEAYYDVSSTTTFQIARHLT